jgi:3-hydroxyisobutyrate dehydrogenase-like beta-hydroxyacid dehydrogenase
VHARACVPYISAPVFGRPDVAEAGKLNIVAAGAAALIDRAGPLLDAMGAKTWRFGDDPTRANAVKLAGNFMLISAIEAMAEACALTEGHGVAGADFLDLMTNTLFASPVYKGYGASIAQNRYEPPGFILKLGAKDVRLALQAAEGAGVAISHGDGENDLAALARVSARRAGQG